MSGPVTSADTTPEPHDAAAAALPHTVELLASREHEVGGVPVRRAFPRRAHRTVGAWCFGDHMGPVAVTETHGVDIAPHPHIGLQTVTWLVAGEVLHRDSLGSDQVVRAGQCNLMTAGNGVSHSEEATGRYRGPLHGIQLWVAQPERTRHGAPAFEHHAALPEYELAAGTVTVVVGDVGGVESPARRDTDHVGAELRLRAGRSVVPVRRAHEHALVVIDGSVRIDGTVVEPGRLAYLGTDRDELALDTTADAVAFLVGGEPFGEEIAMWWNFVARTPDELAAARRDWEEGSDRFGTVASPLARTPAPPPSWGMPRGT